MPSEISKYLYTDEEMRPVYGKMAKSFNYAEVRILSMKLSGHKSTDGIILFIRSCMLTV